MESERQDERKKVWGGGSIEVQSLLMFPIGHKSISKLYLIFASFMKLKFLNLKIIQKMFKKGFTHKSYKKIHSNFKPT